MEIRGVYPDKVRQDRALARSLQSDHMERYSPIPNTVMINQWRNDDRWIVVDSTYPAQIRRRYDLLLRQHDMVIDRLSDEDVHAAEFELRNAVVDYVLQTYPDYFKRDGGLVLVPLSGLAVDISPNGADPLVAIALLASEDMLLLLPEIRGPAENVVFALKSGALLFPNDWGLRSHFNKPRPSAEEALQEWERERQSSLRAARLGKTPYEIHHGRVDYYIEHYATRVDLFFAQMRPGMRAWRRNWAIKMSNELFLHADAAATPLPELTAENWAKYGYLRSEQQTFTKLPETRAVVFSIKTYLWKLSEVMRNATALNALIIANDKLPPAMVDYKARELRTFRKFLEWHRPGPTLL
jgi:hypothetical protein